MKLRASAHAGVRGSSSRFSAAASSRQLHLWWAHELELEWLGEPLMRKVSSDFTCSVCGANCKACTSSSLCSICSEGYTLASGVDQGRCLACVSPCATCQGSSNYCLSCVDGYTRTSWKCQNNRNVQFAFTLDTTPAAFLPKIDTFVATLLSILGENRTNTDAVTIDSVAEG